MWWWWGVLYFALATLSPVRASRPQFTGIWLGPMADMDGCVEEKPLALTGNRTLTVQPVAICCIDDAIPSPHYHNL